MVYTEEWGENQGLLDYVKENHPREHRIHATTDDDPLVADFRKRAEETFDRLGVVRRGIVVCLSIQKPEEGDGYHQDYPHTHRAVLIYYLDPSDVPTPLHIFDGEVVVEEVVPHAGLMAYVPDNVSHGVPRHKGSRERIQIIAAAK